MEAAGVAFEFHQASALGAEVEQHFGKQVLQVSVVKFGGVSDGMELGVGDVEGGAELMGGFLRGVDVDAPQFLYGLGCAQKACHLYTVTRTAARFKGVDKVAAYVAEELFCLRDKKRERMFQTVDLIEFIAFHHHHRSTGAVGIADIGDRFDSERPRILQLHVVRIVEYLPQTADHSHRKASRTGAHGSRRPFLNFF